MNHRCRPIAFAVVAVLPWISAAHALINPRFTPVHLVEQSALIVWVDLKQGQSKDQYIAAIREVLKGKTELKSFQLDLSRARDAQSADILRKLAAVGKPALFFVGELDAADQGGPVTRRRGLLHISGRWAVFDGGQDGLWVFDRVDRTLQSIWAGGTDMLRRVVDYIRADDDPEVPVTDGVAWSEGPVTVLLAGIALRAAEQPDLKILTDQLIGQGSSTAQRTPEQLDAIYAQVLDVLMPDMASEDLAKRNVRADTLERIVFRASRPNAEADRAACSKAIGARLGPEVAPVARTWLIRQLERIGRAEAVRPLAKALADKDPSVRESARRALQKNPAKEANTALLEALASASVPAWRVALLNALAERRDPANLGALLKEAAAENDDVRTAAVLALAKLGDKSAAPAIAAAMAKGPPQSRRTAADSYLRLAEALAAKNDEAGALAIYREMLAAGGHAKCAAVVGLGRAGGAAELSTVFASAADEDPRIRGACVEALSLFKGKDTAGAIVARLQGAGPEAKVVLLRALVLRGDRSGAPALAAAAEDPEEAVRVTALTGLGTVGSASSVPLLLKAAATSGKTQEAARQTLLVLAGAEVDKALLAAMDGPDPRVRTEAILALASRHVVAATAALLKAAEDPDAGVRSAAIKALGVVAPSDALPALTAVLTKTDDDTSRGEAVNALVRIANRDRDIEARTEPMLKAVASASGPAKHALLSVLGRIGGRRSLACVTAAVKDGDEQVRDAAIRALAEWPDGAVAQDLLAVYQGVADEKQQVVAFSGYVRVCRRKPDAERAAPLVTGLRAAKRPGEKKMALGALGDARDMVALEAVLPYMDDEEVKEEAAAAAIRLSRDLCERHPERVKAALEKALRIARHEHWQREGK